MYTNNTKRIANIVGEYIYCFLCFQIGQNFTTTTQYRQPGIPMKAKCVTK